MKILVVDDNREFADSLKDLLSLKRYEAEVAYSGSEAMSLVERQHFDLILLDLIMPGQDGITVLGDMARRGIRTPTMVMTAFSEEERLKKARELGARCCLTKPLAFKQLENLIKGTKP